MSWARPYIAQLAEGKVVQFRPRGNSMTPRIHSGALVTVEPVDPTTVKTHDIVLCTVRGRHFLHLVHQVSDGGGWRFQIGNNHGHINGWVNAKAIHGKLTKVEP